jgi:Cu-processing system ATP-binding protein
MTGTVEIRNVVKCFGKVEAVRDVSFSLPEGETVALVGHNGAGKTTLMKLMLGLIRPTSGSIAVLGDDPAAGQFEARRRLGYLPENVSFNAALTWTRDAGVLRAPQAESAKACRPLLERVGLTHAANRRVGTYSKGMRQRLGLAQALLGEPRLLLLDEPTTGLDPALRQSFYEIVEELRGRGATVLLSSHALTELEERAGRVVIMNRGIKVADGTLDQLVASPGYRPASASRSPTPDSLTCRTGSVPWRDGGGSTAIWSRSMPRRRGRSRCCGGATDEGAPVEDIDVVPPTLDELYAHFLLSQETAR